MRDKEMTKEVYIRLKDGEKEAELKIEVIEPEHQLSMIDGMLRFFDVQVDFKELSDIYRRSGKAYQEFYEKIDSDKNYEDEKPEEKPAEKIDSEKYAEELKIQNDHYVTGMKYDLLNNPLYRCRYKCTCGAESNHYVRVGTKYIHCYTCNRALKVKPATTFGEVEHGKNPELYRDNKGNFYVAGRFEQEVKTPDDAEKDLEN
jgi:hypothetical protein